VLEVPGAIVDDPDTAAAFDGSSAYVDIDGAIGFPFNYANNFTLEAWVTNPGQTFVPAGRILSNGVPGVNGYGFGILLPTNPDHPDSLRFTTYGIKDYDSDVVVPNDGNYHHVVVTMDLFNSANFSLDGVLMQTIAGPSPANSSLLNLQIGRNPMSNIEYYNGNLDEVAVYQTVLSDDQIANHYNIGVSGGRLVNHGRPIPL